MEFRILGPLEVASGVGVAELGPPKQRAVLAVLLLHANEIVPTDRLIDLVWGASPPRTAAHSVQLYVSELRRALAPVVGHDAIVTRSPGYLLQVDPGSIDATRFERLVHEGIREIRAGDRSTGPTKLRAALEQWRGPPLSDLTYEEFAQPEIRRLHGLHLDAMEELALSDLESDRVPEALALVEAVMTEDPLRERSRELLMLSLYRAGRHSDALRSFQRYRELLAEELGLDPSPSLQRLQERILIHDPSLLPSAISPAAPAPNPYKGLRAFRESDAEDFFGRDALVQRLLDALDGGSRLLALVGPSGCGKSSVVAAGLVPAVRRGAIDGSKGWPVVSMTPGVRPLERLEDVRRELPERGPRLLVVDQLEEAFSMADAGEAAAFLRTLAELTSGPDTGLRVLLTLRADFYDRPLLHPALAPGFAAGVVSVVPMALDELEDAIVEPARRAGVEVEPGLLAELVAETAGEPGALPLLQYTLTELFDRREGPQLTQADYRSLGGLQGIVARRSEILFTGLDEERQHACLQVFLRLVRLGDGASDTRRRTPLRELTALGLDPVALSDVVEAFGHHRLLTFDWDPSTDEATIELAHEALLREWDRLAGWIERQRDDLLRLGSLTNAAEEWEAAGRDPDYLLTGGRLAGYEEWRRRTDLQLGARERAFLRAGLERRRLHEETEAARQEDHVRLERRARTRLFEVIAEGRMAGPEVVWRRPDVILVWEGYGDAGWNDAMGTGFDRAVEELDLHAERRVIPLESRDPLTPELRRIAEDGIGLIVVGSASLDLPGLEAVADDHPGSRFIAIDAEEGDRPNVTYVTLKEQEGSFLAGAAAALRSTSGVIGFIGGTDNALILRFAAGYAAGARRLRPDIDVRFAYLDPGGGFERFWGFADPRKASEEAERLYSAGADVVYVAAGSSGFGVFDAAHRCSERLRRDLWAIGVDLDQYRSLARLQDVPDEITTAWRTHILTSMVKHFDVALVPLLEDYARGGLAGGVRRFGLAEGAMDLADSGGFIDDLRPTIEDLRARIVSGDIVVPVRPEAL